MSKRISLPFRMKASPLLQLFLEVAEKATQIARVIRKEKALLELLIEEKPEIKKNHQYFQDFKTLADVLIQETVRHFISQKVSSGGVFNCINLKLSMFLLLQIFML